MMTCFFNSSTSDIFTSVAFSFSVKALHFSLAASALRESSSKSMSPFSLRKFMVCAICLAVTVIGIVLAVILNARFDKDFQKPEAEAKA